MNVAVIIAGGSGTYPVMYDYNIVWIADLFQPQQAVADRLLSSTAINIKLTTRDDLELFKAYMKMEKDNWLK